MTHGFNLAVSSADDRQSQRPVRRVRNGFEPLAVSSADDRQSQPYSAPLLPNKFDDLQYPQRMIASLSLEDIANIHAEVPLAVSSADDRQSQHLKAQFEALADLDLQYPQRMIASLSEMRYSHD